MNATVELVGGEWDGRIITVHDSIVKQRYMLLPSQPELTLSFNPGPLSEDVVQYETQRWEWDGTHSKGGAFRFRRTA
jgi:hypothetical protein